MGFLDEERSNRARPLYGFIRLSASVLSRGEGESESIGIRHSSSETLMCPSLFLVSSKALKCYLSILSDQRYNNTMHLKS